ncbi:MAG: ribonucleotide reductase, partial [Motiliproteus sp.]|nr:ribonucleotide reductase [Motiliproteus sp.]
MFQPDWDNPLEAAIPSPQSFQPEQQTVTDSAAVTPLLEALPPINPDDKRVVNGMTDINQLAPFKYPWAWQYFLNANKNHWTPLDINMTADVH